MKYIFELRAIPSVHESAQSKIQKFINGTAKLPAPWGSNVEKDVYVDRSGPIHSVSVSKILGNGLKGKIYYGNYCESSEEVNNDDFAAISLDPRKIDLNVFVDQVFMKYVSLFGAYFAGFYDEAFIYKDFDRERSFDGDIRTRIYRLPAVGYFSEQLCQTSFGLRSGELVKLLNGAVDTVQEYEGGLLLVLARKVLPTDEMDALCWSIHRLIRGTDERRCGLMPWVLD